MDNTEKVEETAEETATDVVTEPVVKVAKRRKRRTKKAKTPAVRKNYGTFYQAWPKVKDLRIFCKQDGTPRTGLEGEALAKANELIREYKNG